MLSGRKPQPRLYLSTKTPKYKQQKKKKKKIEVIIPVF